MDSKRELVQPRFFSEIEGRPLYMRILRYAVMLFAVVMALFCFKARAFAGTVSGNYVINGDNSVTLTEDTTVTGDLIVTKNTLYLDGHLLKVKGNVIINGGSLSVRDGSVLLAEKDVRCESGGLNVSSDSEVQINGSLLVYKLNALGNITTSTIDIEFDEGSTVSVGKDFIYNSTQGTSRWSSGRLTTYFAGNLNVGGDFISKLDSAGYTGVITLNGSGEQLVDIPAGTRIAHLESNKENVKFGKYLNVTIFNPIKVKTDETTLYVTKELDVNGKTMDVPVSMIVQSDVKVGSGGYLNVKGDVQVESSGMSVPDTANLNISGSLLIQKKDAAGKITTSTADIEFDEGSTVSVGKDFVYNSTRGYEKWSSGRLTTVFNGNLNVGGNFISKQECAGYGGVITLNGSGEQLVDIPANTRIAHLESNKENVKFGKYLNVTIYSPIKVKTDETTLYVTKELDVNGKTMEVPVNMVTQSSVRFGSGGMLNVDGDVQIESSGLSVPDKAKLKIGGSLLIQSKDALGDIATSTADIEFFEGSTVSVGKDFVYNSTRGYEKWSSGRLTTVFNGNLNVGGNFISKQGCAGFNCNMNLSGNYVTDVEMNWGGTVTIQSKSATLDSKGKINKLVIPVGKSNYTFKNGECYNTLIATSVVKFDANGGSVDSEGKSVTTQSKYGELPVPVRDGYTFAGWYTDAEGKDLITETADVSAVDDHTLYAHWEAEGDNEGSPMHIEGLHLKWNEVDGKAYWYEDGEKQGTYFDKKGVIGDGTVRGREICDNSILDEFGNGTWFWLDSVYHGAKAVGKEVWVPYIYQNESEWDDETKRNIANESDPGMGDLVYKYMTEGKGKWVRYDENGRMLKGWVTIEGALAEKYPDQVGNTYYYDSRTGLMAKGWITIDGVSYYFDEQSGVRQ